MENLMEFDCGDRHNCFYATKLKGTKMGTIKNLYF